jgi:hypothetical protein
MLFTLQSTISVQAKVASVRVRDDVVQEYDEERK